MPEFSTRGDIERIAELGMLRVPGKAWSIARSRQAMIAPLAEKAVITAAEAREAAAALGVSDRTVYALVRRFRISGGLLASLAPSVSSGGRGQRRMPMRVEEIITKAIHDIYLTRQKRRVIRVIKEVGQRCREFGLPVPSPNTIKRRLDAIRADEIARRRDGAKSPAFRRLAPAAGAGLKAVQPLEIVQMDHTPVDLIVVDEVHRLPIGRPWLTVAIDVYSRCITGFLVSLEAPSATSVGLCLAQAGVDKSSYLKRLNIDAQWPVSGLARILHVDNAREFHSEALARGCQQYGIELDYRPIGQPHFGGTIERLIGTMMNMVHDLPGTTFSNPTERGSYDSDKSATLTLSELERWLALAIVGPYHNDVHEGLMEPPLARWRRGIEEYGLPRPVTAEKAFLIDFLPVVRRVIRRDGFTLDHIGYYSDVLRPWIANRDRCQSFLIRRDPRDLSQIYVLEPEGRAYVTIPCRRLERPGISLFEHRQAIAQIKAAGRAEVDEETIFRTINQQREVVRVAASKNRAARRQLARQPAVIPTPITQIPSAPTPKPGSDAPSQPAITPFPTERW